MRKRQKVLIVCVTIFLDDKGRTSGVHIIIMRPSCFVVSEEVHPPTYSAEVASTHGGLSPLIP